MIVGLLQTPEYAREVLRLPSGMGDDVSEEQIGLMIAGRMRRQAILHEPGRAVTLLMGEAALWTRVTSRSTHVAQLEHVAHAAEYLKTVTVAIVPFGMRVPIVSLSGFALYDDLVTVETLAGDLELADPVELDEYLDYTRMLLGVSATGPDAATLVRGVAGRQAQGPAGDKIEGSS